MKTTYHVCTSILDWRDPQSAHCAIQHPRSAAHRSLRTAILAEQAIQRGCRRYHGPKTWVDTKILASEDAGSTFRIMTNDELDEAAYIDDQLEVERHNKTGLG